MILILGSGQTGHYLLLGGTDFFFGRGGTEGEGGNGGGGGGGSLEYYRASGGKFYCDRTKILWAPSLSSTLPPPLGDKCGPVP